MIGTILQIICILIATTALTIAFSALIVGYIEDRPDGIMCRIWNTGWAGQVIFILITTFLSMLIFT